ncbi:MAG: DUF424 family protein [Candidatus Diapherotrites archaeon]|nr:DUF424 family protein [Candidatus Diapherotrites archaeon]
MIAKIHEAQGEIILAACDSELMGKNFEEGDLSLRVTERFYNGFELEEEQLEELMDECTIANLVGEKVIAIAVRKKLVKSDRVIRIAGVPHAQFARMLKR